MAIPAGAANVAPTYVIEMTPPGRAAVAVVLAAGPAATTAVAKFLRATSGRPLAAVPVNRIAVGRWGEATGEELVVCRRSENRVEVHCHGGSAAVRAVLDALMREGCEPLSWREWLIRSEDNPIVSEAQIALASALTIRTAGILLDQLNGALTAVLQKLVRQITDANWSIAEQLADGLLQRRDLGMHLTMPWRVVFAGAPNVGKSSLFNALVGYQRAIVSPTPGTTRDVVTASTAIDGWPVELADTAGLRTTQNALETAGVELAKAALAAADLVILVDDAAQSASNDLPLPAWPARVIRARNKIDLVGGEASQVQASMPAPPMQMVSALTGAGIPALVGAIALDLVPEPPAIGQAIPFTSRQVELIVAARNAIERHHEAAAIESLQPLLLRAATVD